MIHRNNEKNVMQNFFVIQNVRQRYNSLGDNKINDDMVLNKLLRTLLKKF